MTFGLIGYRGSGKTTVGRIVAARLKWGFVDCDERIVRLTGMTIREIFERRGERAFRDLESQVIDEVSRLRQTIISFGGGALDRVENCKAVIAAGVKLVYLRCQPAELLRRIQSDPQTAANRPNLTALAGGIEEIQLVLARREPVWKTLIAGEVDVTTLTAEQVADEVFKLCNSF
jgi:shikimate kinase